MYERYEEKEVRKHYPKLRARFAFLQNFYAY
ncbi:hypothetical protein CUPA0133 [Campylobacter upsaliensis RM3195]|nr:hypothetical protein CUPA0133 [Campylobacter upsaliensis RM3195]